MPSELAFPALPRGGNFKEQHLNDNKDKHRNTHTRARLFKDNNKEEMVLKS